jgi:putative sporulation protein YtaF
MPHLFSTIILAIFNNIDNLAVGIAYGVKKIKIGIFSNLIIAVVSGVGTYFSMSLGGIISQLLPANLANLIGSLALIFIGVWGIWDVWNTEIKPRKKLHKNELDYTLFIAQPERADWDKSNSIDVKESVGLALALTINNLAGGIGAGISGVNIIYTTLLTVILSLAAIALGQLLGRKLTKNLSSKWSGIISAFLIICLGVYEYFH